MAGAETNPPPVQLFNHRLVLSGATAPARGVSLRPGLVIAIKPWFLAGGTDDYRVDADGWTLRSADGSRAAHVEHTVAVTENGPRILTAPR